MPAGNDAHNAAQELADKFGTGDAKAEDLIAASRARYTPEVREAQLATVDEEATEELREEGFGKVAKTVGVKEAQILDACVAGKFIRYVASDEDGITFKGAFLADDVGKSAKTAEKNAADEVEPEKPKARSRAKK